MNNYNTYTYSYTNNFMIINKIFIKMNKDEFILILYKHLMLWNFYFSKNYYLVLLLKYYLNLKK
jgi:hypothetical protein